MAIPDPINYYTFDSDATDSVGSTDGTVTGAVQATGKINNGYDFDGANDRITYDGSDTNSLSSGSFAFWGKASDTAQQYNFLAKGSAVTRVQVGGASRDQIGFKVNGESYAYTGSILTVTDWNHYVFTWDGTNKKIYVNGSLEDTTATTNALPSSGSLYLGYNGVNTSEEFDGLIDEFGVWDVALTLSEVEELYNSGDGIQYPFTGGDEATFNALSFGVNF